MPTAPLPHDPPPQDGAAHGTSPHGASGSPPAPAASVDAIVLAGGRGVRMGAPVNKVWLEVDGRPLIARPLMVLAADPRVRDLHLVVGTEDLPAARALVAKLALAGLAPPVPGGATRPASERAGLAALRPGAALVLIHDGARAALDPALVARVCDAAHHVGGAVPVIDFSRPVFGVDTTGHAVPATDLVAGQAPGAAVLQRVQTPQVFARAALMAAYEAAAAGRFSGLDTADTVQHFSNLPIAAVAGDPGNIKVTYPADLARITPALRAIDDA